MRIPPRVRPQHTARIQENPETTNQKALQPNPVQDYDYERGRKESSERRFEERQQRRSKSTHRHPADEPNKSVVHRSGRSKERSTDMEGALHFTASEVSADEITAPISPHRTSPLAKVTAFALHRRQITPPCKSPP